MNRVLLTFGLVLLLSGGAFAAMGDRETWPFLVGVGAVLAVLGLGLGRRD